MDREVRSLIQQKGSKVKVVTKPPMPSEGEDGDIYLLGLGTNGTLFVKGFGKWWAFRSTDVKGDGWHGSTARVKILPSQFVTAHTPSTAVAYHTGYIKAFQAGGGSFTNAKLIANVSVPLQYSVKGAKIFTTADDTDIIVDIKMGYFSKAGGTTIGTGDTNEYIKCTGALSSEDNFFTIELEDLDDDDELRGGYLDISPVLTPELIQQGVTSEDGLFRGGD